MAVILRFLPRVAAGAAVLCALSGCASTLTEASSDAAGVAGAGIASAVTSNGTVTAAIGLGVQSLAATGLSYTERRVHRTEQDEIAAVAGGLPVGGLAAWHVHHTIPIEDDEHGDVTVSRAIDGVGLDCKEVVFSVDHETKKGPRRSFYVTSICRDGGKWKWAAAEPATTRWGTLQ